MLPPFTEYVSPQVEVKVALPTNLTPNGEAISGTLPGESSIRASMMDFVEKVQEMHAQVRGDNEHMGMVDR